MSSFYSVVLGLDEAAVPTVLGGRPCPAVVHPPGLVLAVLDQEPGGFGRRRVDGGGGVPPQGDGPEVGRAGQAVDPGCGGRL